jgi:hypothetical protein
MDITPYIDQLRAELVAVAEAGGPEAKAAAERLTMALDPATRMAMLELLSEAAAEVSTLIPSGSIDVRLRGREAEFVVDVPPPPPAEETAPGQAAPADEDDGEDGGDVVRITLRLPESVKTRAEELAARSGRSLNAWIVTALKTATRERGATLEVDLGSLVSGDSWPFGARGGPGRRSSKRMSGWV